MTKRYYHTTLHITPRADGFFNSYIESDFDSLGNQWSRLAMTDYQVTDLIIKLNNHVNHYNNAVHVNSNLQPIFCHMTLNIERDHE